MQWKIQINIDGFSQWFSSASGWGAEIAELRRKMETKQHPRIAELHACSHESSINQHFSLFSWGLLHIFYCILGYNWRTKFSKIPVMWKKGGWGSTDVFTMRKKTSKIAEEGFPKSLDYNNRRVSLNERSAKIKFESCVIKSAIRPLTSPTSLASATTIIVRHEICA